MSVFHSDDWVTILLGDVREVLADVADGSCNMCVTSPPYYGLRNYGVEGQLGLEPTPDEYVAEMVAVFREVRRVLRDDGVLWLNLGDSYAGSGKGAWDNKDGGQKEVYIPDSDSPQTQIPKVPDGLKPKNLIGIPWLVAKALQAPFYTGKIKNELDRVWLAATIDAEGSICGFTHERKDDGTIRTGIHIHITNTNRPLLDNAFRIWPTSRQDHNLHGEGHLGSADTYRWIAHNVDEKAELLRELYPYFIAKKKQALLAWNFLELSKEAKRLARTAEAASVKDRRAWIVGAISRLNHFQDVDVPNWCIEPPSCYEPGWFLRQDVIWSKPNPMPESVRDRCTKAHEYLFLLSKSPRYYYDHEAIQEQAGEPQHRTVFDNTPPPPPGAPPHSGLRKSGNKERRYPPSTGRPDDHLASGVPWEGYKRNKRSVWTVATQPYAKAHFATFPPKLIEPCIMAGCPKGGIVLDPFLGSGTTAEVARRLGCKTVGVELNEEYARLAVDRIRQGVLDFGGEQ